MGETQLLQTTCKKYGGRGESYKPSFQNFEWTIRFYDEHDDTLLAAHQYLCVKDDSFVVELYKEGNDYKIGIAAFPIDETLKRPIYVIGHRCNDIEDIKKAFENKANAVECDIWLDDDEVWWVNHNKFRTTKLLDWLDEAKRIADIKGEVFALIMFDIKTAKKLGSLKTEINKKLPSDLNVIYSVPTLEDANAFTEITNNLSEHEGVAIDYEDSPEDVQKFFEDKEIKNGWYGIGINVGFPDKEIHRTTLETAGLIRNQNKRIKKTFIWTIELKKTMGDYLYIEAVDGMITNCGASARPDFVDHAREIIDNSPILRYATRRDNAFEVFEYKKIV